MLIALIISDTSCNHTCLDYLLDFKGKKNYINSLQVEPYYSKPLQHYSFSSIKNPYLSIFKYLNA